MTGAADLPLHDGHVPPWMLKVMKSLTENIVKVIVDERGPDGLVRALADPFWFQAFNNVIGMDWDSSGSTTVVVTLLKEISWSNELGFLVLGGKGKRMLQVKEEAEKAERLLGVNSEEAFTFSKVAARAASTFLQDGYETYVHALVLTGKGPQLVIQQGMNLRTRMARRYHIDRASVEEPFSGVAGYRSNITLNATAKESRAARKAYLDIIAEGKERLLRLLAQSNAALGAPNLLRYIEGEVKAPEPKAYYKPVVPSRQLLRSLDIIYRNPPQNEEDLATVEGLGPTMVRALALIADIIYSVPTSERDPVTLSMDPFAYAYAIGGKDGVPYPFDRKVAEEAIEYLARAIEESALGNAQRLRAMARLRQYLARYGVVL
ncbi:DUF763 domain-containing protein [Acidilobus saccharovorans]|nr:DUF763 domain-containing protein [Acidilobus saccharovorans]